MIEPANGIPMSDDAEDFAISEAMRATAYDLRKLANDHVEQLREEGNDDLADNIERIAREAEARAEEWDTKG
jgi:hypothetical protein